MIYTEKTKLALQIMFNTHKDQKDKGNTPYIFHPYHLAEQMTTEDEIILALLHDTVEDSSLTVDDIKAYGFNNNIIEALRIITKDKQMNYTDYIKRIGSNKLAKKIKLKDLEHNMDLSRISNPTKEDYERVEKYKKAIELLNNMI